MREQHTLTLINTVNCKTSPKKVAELNGEVMCYSIVVQGNNDCRQVRVYKSHLTSKYLNDLLNNTLDTHVVWFIWLFEYGYRREFLFHCNT